MTKYKTTEREQRANNNLIISFSYCSIQNIERFLKAQAYTCGMYGWKADFYVTDFFNYKYLKDILNNYNIKRKSIKNWWKE